MAFGRRRPPRITKQRFRERTMRYSRMDNITDGDHLIQLVPGQMFVIQGGVLDPTTDPTPIFQIQSTNPDWAGESAIEFGWDNHCGYIALSCLDDSDGPFFVVDHAIKDAGEGAITWIDADNTLVANAGLLHIDVANTLLTVNAAGTFANTVTVQVGGITVTGNSTIAGTLSSLTGLSSSGNIEFSGMLTGDTDTVVTHNAGLLETRIIDSRVWGNTLLSGLGTVDVVPRWATDNTLTESSITDNGALVVVNSAAEVTGAVTLSGLSADTVNTVVVSNGGALGTRVLNDAAFGADVVTGTGTADQLTRWTGDHTIADAGIEDDGSAITIQRPASTTGTLTVGSLGAGGTDTIVVHNAGLLESRTVDARVWGNTLVDGTGTTNTVPRWTGSQTVGNSQITDDGTLVTIVGAPVDAQRLLIHGKTTIDTEAGGGNSPQLTLRGVRPNMRYHLVQNTDGGLAFNLVRCDVTNMRAQNANTAVFGVLASTGTDPNPPTGTYVYIDARDTGTFDQATLKVDALNRIGVAMPGTDRPARPVDVWDNSNTALALCRLRQNGSGDAFTQLNMNLLSTNWAYGAHSSGEFRLAHSFAITNAVAMVRGTSAALWRVGTAGVGAPTSRWQVTGSFATTTTAIASNTTLDAAHSTILANSDSAAITITLPLANSCPGRIYVIKRMTDSANTITLQRSGTNLIDGNTTLTVSASQWAFVRVQSDGSSAWLTV
jgi:hypothetical protein